MAAIAFACQFTDPVPPALLSGVPPAALDGELVVDVVPITLPAESKC
jgi:hypothetical protein